MRALLLAVSLLLGMPAALAQQYIFAWPPGEPMLKPRGGTTRGVPVTYDKEPSEGWRKLREPGLSPQERDRRAILAMAGPYRVTFDFLEVVRFDPALKPDAPYQSWATEYVFVAEDRPDFIALQHVLLMRISGKANEPLVQRHWRQEWRYEAGKLLVYEGANTWAVRPVPGERRGAWTQTVLQVDDSPRYAARGRWEHGETNSTWLSDETWRPLPRREFSVRKDYQVLVGSNRHTVTPLGWVQEENNLKVVLVDKRAIAREYGVARYERIRDFDFEPARRSFAATEPFWGEVRAAWRELEEQRGRFALRAQPDQGNLFIAFFEYAAKLEEGTPFDRDAARAFIRRTLDARYLTAPS
ncbi:MAG: hypothetical protein QOD26_3720 [Betaproteobacteria bacterium]|jgi:hypothetical protein|nr:hypothetical protein [Betaproteobacteria bacterium]